MFIVVDLEKTGRPGESRTVGNLRVRENHC